ncbi:MAG: (Fe-S)-binding protein [Planctomycetota bacterium]|nr:MAG: (Fe-S)-binding protein [Planctomycetota bacterium]
MANIEIDKERCKGCCLCVSECPRGNIRMSELLNSSGHTCAEIIELSECNACALCCQICPDLAIRIHASDETPPGPLIRIQETGVSKQPSGDRKQETPIGGQE